ncbi:MAG: HAMP domain-containing sensor histidine kinase [Candidatus Binatia bacterium]
MADRGRTRAADAGQDEEDDGALFAQLVHDLRNPLGVIAYFAEALPEADEQEKQEFAERLQLNARRALQVVEEFALLADLRHGRAVPDDAEWDGRALLEALIAEVEALERRPGAVRFDPTDGARLRGDRSQLACALRGVLRETVRNSPGEAILARLSDDDGCAVLTLTVPLRVDRELEIVPRFDETALAVELARGVAQLHGGTLSVEQRPGRATLALALPRWCRIRNSGTASLALGVPGGCAASEYAPIFLRRRAVPDTPIAHRSGTAISDPRHQRPRRDGTRLRARAPAEDPRRQDSGLVAGGRGVDLDVDVGVAVGPLQDAADGPAARRGRRAWRGSRRRRPGKPARAVDGLVQRGEHEHRRAWVLVSARRRRQTSKPLRSGIMTSSTIRSGGSADMASPSGPLPAVMTSRGMPLRCRKSVMRWRKSASSSITRTR